MSVQDDMVRDYGNASRAMKHFNSYLLEFQAALLRYDYETAALAHEGAAMSIDNYFLHYAAAAKRQQAAER